MRVFWWAARYLFIIAAILLVFSILDLEYYPGIGVLGAFIAIGYAIVAPIRAWRRRSRKGGE